MMQWVAENTGYKGEDKPTKLDFILMRGMDLTKEPRRVVTNLFTKLWY